MSSDTSTAVQNISGLTLMEGEEVLHDQRPRWRDYPWSILLGIATSIALVGFLILAWVWWRRRKERMVVTTERVIQRRASLGSVTTQEYPIRDINQLQTSGDRFNFIGAEHGSIEFSVGGGGELVQLSNVRHYSSVANSIREQQRRIAERS